MEIDIPRVISEGHLSLHSAIKKLYGKWHLFGGQKRCCHEEPAFYAIVTTSCLTYFVSVLTCGVEQVYHKSIFIARECLIQAFRQPSLA
jgi:hypothetical protein